MQETKKLKPISLNNVNLIHGLLADKNQLVRKEVIPYQWKALNDEISDADPSNAIENFRIAAGDSEGEFIGMVFQDSDVAKWLEAVAYQLSTNPDEELENLADGVINLIEKAQEDDGYLNTYFTINEPDKKWTNLTECHELYCAGHMLEAAVAYYQATGKRKLLDVMIRFIDLIDEKFGPEPAKLKGYPGHQEIELALIRLYQIEQDEKYLKLAKYFIDERGKEPNYFIKEWEARDKISHWTGKESGKPLLDYCQAHKPVREQDVAIGHAVRALYMYSGMADVALETQNQSLIDACESLWNNTTKRQMYITGGVGSSGHLESFTFDYDLPNDTAYTETCAAIALVFFAQRMMHLSQKGEYGDVMERALYNGVLSGISEDGQRFFYVNPLEVEPEICEKRNDHHHVKPVRQKWFGCACCPPNIARLLASIGQYIYSYNQEEIYVNLYADSNADFELAGQNVHLRQKTEYPWDENISLEISLEESAEFVLALRIPSWCKKPELRLNGELLDLEELSIDGYAYLKRQWYNGDLVELALDMPVEKIYAHPAVRENMGKIAMQRGPIVYCLEEVDNGGNLPTVFLKADSDFEVNYRDKLLGGVALIKAEGYRMDGSAWDNVLYSTKEYMKEDIEITAVPYYAWNNRENGEMMVWINESK